MQRMFDQLIKGLKMMNFRVVTFLGFFAAMGLLSGCQPSKHERPNVVYMPDMAYTPAVKAQTKQNRLPPEGSIPVNYHPFPFDNEVEAGDKVLNPYQSNPELLARGKKLYQANCYVCHGASGKGDGPIIGEGKYPYAPSLLSETIRDWKDGSIYFMIRKGRGLMPNYSTQVSNEFDRWSVVLYVRKLQEENK
jgi:mono/diheme cytochrome c family protein